MNSPNSAAIKVHRLNGCRTLPLAHYLKSLGIFRLLAEQKDKNIRGWWKDDTFYIATELSRDDLQEFFLVEYSPTPLITPWNGGSGFFPKDKSAFKSGLSPLENSSEQRFENYRQAIAIGRLSVAGLTDKPDPKTEKNKVIAECRNLARGPLRDWINAAITLDSNGNPAFPALLGTGGNDGRLEFASNFMQRLVELFQVGKTHDLNSSAFAQQQLIQALFAESTPTLQDHKIGQFFPSAAGSPNGSTGVEGGVKVNPWDFILMLEGAVVFQAGISRKCSSESLPQAAASFAFRGSGIGYCSADDADEQDGRGEQWMPIWQQPANLKEIEKLFREGRVQLKSTKVERGTDMARAISRMGVTRGVNYFQRFGYIVRNGLSNLAVPLGEFESKSQPHQNLVDEAAPWVDHLRRLAGSKNAPMSIIRCSRACEESLFNCTQKPSADAFLNLLSRIASAEDQLITSPKFSKENFAKPVPMLSRSWADLIYEAKLNHPEIRLAFALAAQTGPLRSAERSRTVRHHWVPLDEYEKKFLTAESGINSTPEQCARELPLEQALTSIVSRRLIAMGQGATNNWLPLRLSKNTFAASISHINKFINDEVSDDLILKYARGLMCIDLSKPSFRTKSDKSYNFANKYSDSLGGLASYGISRLALGGGSQFYDGKLKRVSNRPIAISSSVSIEVRCDAAIYHRLRNGDLRTATQLAIRRLTSSGLRPQIGLALGSPHYAKRIAASMAFGISDSDMTRLALGLTSPDFEIPPDHNL